MESNLKKFWLFLILFSYHWHKLLFMGQILFLEGAVCLLGAEHSAAF